MEFQIVSYLYSNFDDKIHKLFTIFTLYYTYYVFKLLHISKTVQRFWLFTVEYYCKIVFVY